MPETPPNGFAAEPALLGSLHLAAIIESSDDAVLAKTMHAVDPSAGSDNRPPFMQEHFGKSQGAIAEAENEQARH